MLCTSRGVSRHFHAQVPIVPDAFGTHVAPALVGVTHVRPHATLGQRASLQAWKAQSTAFA